MSEHQFGLLDRQGELTHVAMEELAVIDSHECEEIYASKSDPTNSFELLQTASGVWARITATGSLPDNIEYNYNPNVTEPGSTVATRDETARRRAAYEATIAVGMAHNIINPTVPDLRHTADWDPEHTGEHKVVTPPNPSVGKFVTAATIANEGLVQEKFRVRLMKLEDETEALAEVSRFVLLGKGTSGEQDDIVPGLLINSCRGKEGQLPADCVVSDVYAQPQHSIRGGLR